ncbi:hypothetical protein DFH11DRAFT_1228541 [Phellopilus nigrolimitatus]|nr:hypothetical protein DFH11DRAFT_1228541 [Phellopilus nigrolimitatus]
MELSILIPFQPYLLFACFLAFVAAYYLVSPFYTSDKQRSWILTAISSFAMTCFSLPFVWDYVVGGWTVHAVRTSATFANVVNTFFQAYLIADVLLGAIHYREQVNLLSGWVHHGIYILVVDHASRRSLAHIFSLCACMELPTFIMALGILHPRFRSNTLFATTFFITRIVLHIVFLLSYTEPTNRHKLLDGSLIPSGILACALILHMLWFTKCLKGNIRRYRLRKRVSNMNSHALATTRPEKGTSISSTIHRTVQAARLLPKHSLASVYSRCRNGLLVQTDVAARAGRPWPYLRRDSLERALQTFRAVESAKLELYRATHELQKSERFLEFQRVRRRMYERVPDRQAIYYYVGLHPRDGKPISVY